MVAKLRSGKPDSKRGSAKITPKQPATEGSPGICTIPPTSPSSSLRKPRTRRTTKNMSTKPPATEGSPGNYAIPPTSPSSSLRKPRTKRTTNNKSTKPRPAGSTATNVAGKAQTPTKMQPPTTASTIATPDSPQVQTLPPTPPTKQSPPPTPDASPNSQKIPPLIRSTAVQRWDDDENRVVVPAAGSSVHFHKSNKVVPGEKSDSETITSNGEQDASVKQDFTWEHFASVPFGEIREAVQKCEFGYRFKSENVAARGTIRYYHCRQIKVKARTQCQRKLMVFIPNDSAINCNINLKGIHTCENADPEDISKVPLGQKNVSDIYEMLRNGIPVRDIKKHVKGSNQQLSINRINYAVKQASREIYGRDSLSLGELATWTKSKSATPTENETAFVIGYDIDQDNGRFRIVYSSVKLLSLFRTLDVLSADCTFKTTMQGYPLMVVCLVDKMRHAHPVAFATVTKQEKADYDFVFSAIFDQCSRLGIDCTVKAFISDGEIALKKAARSVFGEQVLMINCYFHVVQNIKKHITKNKTIPAECKETILKRVAQIQVSPTQLHFETACSLFLKEYKQFPDFVIFFQKYVSDECFRYWYECALPGYPATNNSLEALNRAIKEGHLMRAREPFGTFKGRILSVVESYGKGRQVHEKRNFSLDDERKAFDFIRMGRKTRMVDDWTDKKKYLYLPGKDAMEVTGRDIETFINPKTQNMEQYLKDMEAVRRVTVTDLHWTTWDCCCRWFFKHNSCYHVLVAAVKRGKYQLRPEANTLALTQKRPPGRPKTMSKALQLKTITCYAQSEASTLDRLSLSVCQTQSVIQTTV